MLPPWLCDRVNSVLCTNIATGKFVTLFYGVLDADRNTLCYTNAGHLRPILIHAGGDATQLAEGDAVLGALPNWNYHDTAVQLTPGDRLLLFTDGITEAAQLDGEEFGEERVIAAAGGLAHDSPAELQARLLAQVKEFCASHLSDDATLLIVAVKAATPSLAGVHDLSTQ